MITVYVDVLFIVNLYINYFILLITARILSAGTKKGRLLLSAAVSALLSVVLFFIPLNFLLSTAVRIALAVLMSAVAFGVKNRRRIVKSTLLLFGNSILIAGLTALYIFECRPDFIMLSNSVFYIDLSLVSLCVITLVSYLFVEVIERLLKLSARKELLVKGELCLFGRLVPLTLLCDTGNSLTDAFSGRPVAVCSLESVKKLLPESSFAFFSDGAHSLPEDRIKERCRVVPSYGVSGESLLPAFVCDYLLLHLKEGTVKKQKITIAVTERRILCKDADGIIGPALLDER